MYVVIRLHVRMAVGQKGVNNSSRINNGRTAQPYCIEVETMFAGERSHSHPAFATHKQSTRRSPDAHAKSDQVSDVGREVVVGVCAMNRKVSLHDRLHRLLAIKRYGLGQERHQRFLLSNHDVLSHN